MACMEYQCTNPRCDFFTLGNTPTVNGGRCPKCGANVNSFFDEPVDRSDRSLRMPLDDEESDEEE